MADRTNERTKARENAERYEFARDNGHMDFIKKANKCNAFFDGWEDRQWDETVARTLRAQGKPVLTINKILPTIGTAMGEQLQNVADVSFRATATGNEETAATLDKLWLHIANTNHFDWVRAEVADSGFITSRGIYDIRIAFDDNMRGEVRIKSKNPKNIVIDPEADSYDPDGWKEVFETKWLSPNDIELLYSKAAADELRGRQPQDHVFSFDMIDFPLDQFGNPEGVRRIYTRDRDIHRYIRVIERQYRELSMQPNFIDPVSGDIRPVPQHWDRERIARVAEAANVSVVNRLTEKIRWLTTAADIVLFDAVSAYKHFTFVPYFPYFRHGQTIGLVENLLSPQENLNKARSQELHIINSTANGGWKVKTGTLNNMDIEELEERGSETGLVLELKDIADAEKITANSIPTGLDRSSFKSDEDIKEISGIGDSLRGLDRADVSGKAIEKKSVRGSVNMAKPFANLVRSDHLVASRVLDLVQAYYTEERIFNVTSAGPRRETEEIVINQMNAAGEIMNDLTLGEYDVITTTVPAREQHEDTQFDQALALRELGVAIPDDTLIENSRLARKTELLARLEEGPSEAEQRAEELELRKLEAEVAKMEAEAIQKKADATAKIAQAKGNGGEDVELALKREEAQAKIELEREKMRATLAIEREKMIREDRRERAKLQLEAQRMAKELALKKQQGAQANAQTA